MPVIKSFFQKIPFIRITSLFMIGILTQHYFPFDHYSIDIILTAAISILIIFWFASTFHRIQVQNILITFTIILSGYFYPVKTLHKHALLPEEKTFFLAEVCQKPQVKRKSFQTILLIQNQSFNKPEKIIAYFSKSGFDSTINIGDQLIIEARAQLIKNRNNPFEFDYEKLMHKKEIWYSVFLTEDQYSKTGIHFNRFRYKAENIREKLITILTTFIPDKRERSVIAALTLGYRVELDPETIDYFASTGAMHVLAVSGLHVGLIYFILGFFLSWIQRKKYGSYLFPAVLIILLWTYAAITGFSASVQRATIMFSFIIIGNVIRRPVNIYNSLSASALLLMLVEPDVIFELGFQLSYLAVFGIVLIQPGLSKMIQIKNKILNFFWTLFTVSIAAQLATFPVAIFYFNQFPNYFWISNFIVIPAATLIIWLTFAFFILSPVQVLAQFLAQILGTTTSLMVGILKWISDLPHAVYEGIITTLTQTFLIYGILISLLIFLLSKRKQWLTFGLFLVIIFQSTNLYSKYKLLNQRMIYLYNSSSNPIQFINGRKNYVILETPDSIPETEVEMIKNVSDHLKLDSPVNLYFSSKNGYESKDLCISENKIHFLDCSITFSKKTFLKSKHTDLLTFRLPNKNPNKKEFINKTISTRSPYFTEKQKIEIDQFTRTDGAFILNLR